MQLRIHVDFSSPSVRFYFPSIHSEDFMNYHDFKQQIISTLSDRLGSDASLFQTFSKTTIPILTDLPFSHPVRTWRPPFIWITTMDSMSAADRFPTSQTTF